MLRDKKDRSKSSSKHIQMKLKGSAENFDELIQKQLKDDFEVHEYLNRNLVDGFEPDGYISLFNKLLAAKRKKLKKKDFIQSNMRKSFQHSKASSLYSDSHSQLMKSRVSPVTSIWDSNQRMEEGNVYYTEQQYLKIKKQSQIEHEQIESKIRGQLEMQRILWKQIMDNKKSLNLMKGDIGHLIARNQSIKTLQSKMNKVSLVATDQLKRVLLALSKDKDQIRLRYQMQKNFHTKMRSIQGIEVNNVRRLKSNYIQSMKRKKEIYEKLSLIEKECASIEEYTDKKRQRSLKNTRSLAVLDLLKKLCRLIETVPQIDSLFKQKQIGIKEYSVQLKTLADIKNIQDADKSKGMSKISFDIFNDNSLYEFHDHILNQYDNLQRELQNLSNISNELIKKLEQLWIKLGFSEGQCTDLMNQINEDQRQHLRLPFSLKDYLNKIKDFSHNLKPIYLLLEFFANRIARSDSTKYVSIIDENHSKLMRIIQYDPETLSIDEKVYTLMLVDIKKNFHKLKEKIFNHSYFIVNKNYQKITKKTQQNYNQEDSSFLSQMENQTPQQNIQQENEICEQFETPQKTEKKTMNEKKVLEEGAKRLQLLQKIDLSYYKMIKSTLQMEKDNTRKNYEFMKTFKRTKYSTQDEILEQKRFQSSFSGLFSSQKVSRSNHTSKQFSQSGNTRKNFSKFKPSHTNKSNVSLYQGGSTNSLFVLTAPPPQTQKKTEKIKKSKKSKISKPVREILDEI